MKVAKTCDFLILFEKFENSQTMKEKSWYKVYNYVG